MQNDVQCICYITSTLVHFEIQAYNKYHILYELKRSSFQQIKDFCP